ncbi:MAG TPA: hypothetical protein VFT23_04740 [Burkholderiales bacterium]|nr:hypothetical protein [Burkholderiales bacterium]
MALGRISLSAFAVAMLAASCATPEVAGTYEAKALSVTLDPHGGAAVSTAFPGRPSRSLVQGTWTQGEGGVVILTLKGPRPEQMIFQHAGDELIARDWDRATWGQAGPGTLRRKQP